MNSEQVKNILRDIYDRIQSAEIIKEDKSTNWYIDDKPVDPEREY